MKKYIFAAFVAVLSVTCFASYSFGLDEESEKKKLKVLHSCISCDLKGYDMDGSDLRFANFALSNLTRASLVRANLTGANFAGANLQQANLYKANLTGANLKGAQLFQVRIKEAIFCNTKTPWGLDNSGCK
jgi:uncharacterized protein YjbI with pentapeptide repeats